MARTANHDSANDIELNVDGMHNEVDAVVPPDGGYGWLIVGSCFTLNCFTWGVTAVSNVRAEETARSKYLRLYIIVLWRVPFRISRFRYGS
jgi:hypothetical protein